MARRIGDSRVATIVGNETERDLWLDNSAGDSEIAQTARSIATERGPAAVLIIVDHAEIMVGRGRKEEQTICPDAETTIAQTSNSICLKSVIETRHIVEDDKIIASPLVFAKVYNHRGTLQLVEQRAIALKSFSRIRGNNIVIVGSHDDRDARGIDLYKKLHKLHSGIGIEVASGLVGEDE